MTAAAAAALSSSSVALLPATNKPFAHSHWLIIAGPALEPHLNSIVVRCDKVYYWRPFRVANLSGEINSRLSLHLGGFSALARRRPCFLLVPNTHTMAVEMKSDNTKLTCWLGTQSLWADKDKQTNKQTANCCPVGDPSTLPDANTKSKQHARRSHCPNSIGVPARCCCCCRLAIRLVLTIIIIGSSSGGHLSAGSCVAGDFYSNSIMCSQVNGARSGRARLLLSSSSSSSELPDSIALDSIRFV